MVHFLKDNGHFPLSFCFRYRSDRKVNKRCGINHHYCIFQILDDGTNFSILSRGVILFGVQYIPWKRLV